MVSVLGGCQHAEEEISEVISDLPEEILTLQPFIQEPEKIITQIDLPAAYKYAGEDLPEGEEAPKKEKSDFEKEASTAKAQATKAMNKAVASQDESLVKPAQYKGTLSERYAKAKEFLESQTPETFKLAKPSVIDSLNNLEKELKEKGSIAWAEFIEAKRIELTGIETGNPY